MYASTPMVAGSASSSTSGRASISVMRSPSEPTDAAAEGFVFQKQRGVVGAEVSPLEVQSAIDEQGLARDVTRQVGEQEQDDAGLLLWSATPTHRNGCAVAVGIGVGIGA